MDTVYGLCCYRHSRRFKKYGVSGLRTKRPFAQILRGLLLTGTNCMAVFALSLMPIADAHAILAMAPLL